MKFILISILIFLISCGEEEVAYNVNYIGGEEYINYDRVGKEIIEFSAKDLVWNLNVAIREGGYANALNVCNEKASTITDSLSKKFGLEIGRISNKNRSPENKPMKVDSLVLLMMADQAKDGVVPATSLVKLTGSKYRYYHPIVMQSQCLPCHGNIESNIGSKFYDLIKSKYPNDKAIDFVAGDFRGAWTIDFNAPESSGNQ